MYSKLGAEQRSECLLGTQFLFSFGLAAVKHSKATYCRALLTYLLTQSPTHSVTHLHTHSCSITVFFSQGCGASETYPREYVMGMGIHPEWDTCPLQETMHTHSV